MIEDGLAAPGNNGGEGLRAVCIREVQKDLAQSSKLLIESKLSDFKLGEANGFKVYRDVIRTPGDGLIIFKGMNDYNADSIKSLEGFKRAWWEEAHTATKTSIDLLRPTIRDEDSEVWFSWNPRKKVDPVDVIFRAQTPPTGSVIVEANWRDNPWFPKVLEQERQDCLRDNPDQYDHIWEGGYVTIVEGAYYSKHLARAKASHRLCELEEDPLMTIRLFMDIGGTGAKADSFTIWAAQFIGPFINVLNYYEAVGQPIDAHLRWMHEQGYNPGRAQIWLPHDGIKSDAVYKVSYQSAFMEAGYDVTTIPNQGPGAAMMRVEAGRRQFHRIYFDAPKCEGGIDALGWYHEKKDEQRNIGLGPDHDWSSHAADSFGLMCLCYEIPDEVQSEDFYYEQGRSEVTGY